MSDDASINAKVSGGAAGLVGVHTATVETQTIIGTAIYNFASPPARPTPTAEAGPIPPCPYPGLAYFDPQKATQFFGRERATQALVAAVAKRSFTAIVGASGSGKSSVVLAGLWPRLVAQVSWRSTYFRIGTEPDKNPFAALARALEPLTGERGLSDKLEEVQKLAEKLASGAVNLTNVIAACRATNAGKRILLIADQFEEAFTLVPDDALRERFINALIEAFPDPPQGSTPDICLVLTLRADFYNAALRYRPLADRLQDHVENLGPMTRDELREAIMKPAKAVQVWFEPGLVDTILDDVEKRPGSLPLLQFALREMWGRLSTPLMTRADYGAIGGVEGALAKRAQSIFEAVTMHETDTAAVALFRRLFTRLVTLGEGAEDARRIVTRQELALDEWSLARKLAGEDNRLVVTASTASGQETAEVVHEALIRNWPELVNWVSRDRALIFWRNQLRARLDEWRANPSDPGTLLHGGPLTVAEDWVARRGAELNEEEKNFVSTSVEFRDVEKRKAEAELQERQARLKEVAEAQKERAAAQWKAEQAQIRFNRRLRRIGFVFLVVLVSIVSTLIASYNLADIQLAVDNLDIGAEAEGRGNLRDRLMMLIVASKRVEVWPWSNFPLSFFVRGKSERTDQELRETLLRAPIFGGASSVAFAPDRDQLAYLDDGYMDGRPMGPKVTLRVEDFTSAQTAYAATGSGLSAATEVGVMDLPASDLEDLLGGYDVSLRPALALGYLKPSAPAESSSELIAIAPSNVRNNPDRPNRVLLVKAGQPLFATLPTLDTYSPFPPQLNFAAGSIRIIATSIGEAGVPSNQRVETVTAKVAPDGENVELVGAKAVELDWSPLLRGAPRLPVLSSDCDKIAFLGSSAAAGGASDRYLYVGTFGGGVKERKLGNAPPVTLQVFSSVAMATDCSSVLVRTVKPGDDRRQGDSPASVPETLTRFDISTDGNIGAGQDYSVPGSLAGFVQPSFPLVQPELSAAVDRPGGVPRVAWLVRDGLAAAYLEQDGVRPILPPYAPLFFTGLDTTSNIRLTLSPSTQFLLLTQQRGFTGRPQFRLFDLRTEAREKSLANGHGKALRDEACRVAAIVGTNKLSRVESRAWAGSGSAPPVCD